MSAAACLPRRPRRPRRFRHPRHPAVGLMPCGPLVAFKQPGRPLPGPAPRPRPRPRRVTGVFCRSKSYRSSDQVYIVTHLIAPIAKQTLNFLATRFSQIFSCPYCSLLRQRLCVRSCISHQVGFVAPLRAALLLCHTVHTRCHTDRRGLILRRARCAPEHQARDHLRALSSGQRP